MLGLDAAGKTTILYKLKLGEVVTTLPTIGELVLHKMTVTCSFWFFRLQRRKRRIQKHLLYGVGHRGTAQDSASMEAL
jgi:ADP-ribosylation factor protein 1